MVSPADCPWVQAATGAAESEDGEEEAETEVGGVRDAEISRSLWSSGSPEKSTCRSVSSQ